MADGNSSGREVLFELTAIGGIVRVVAVDAATGVEVTVMGPVSAPRSELQRLALRKLELRLAKDSAAS